MPAGRKSLKEEIKVIERMVELAGPTFDYIKLCLTAGEKEDKRWASEQMMKLYMKAIPQEIGTDPENPIVAIIKYAQPNGDNPPAQVQTPPVSAPTA